MSATTLAAGLGDMTSATISSAGLALGIALLVVELVTWWRGGSGGKGGPAAAEGGGGKAKDPMALIPFGNGIAFGTLMVACPAGLLGYGAGLLRWGGNGAGGLVMSWMTGTDAQTVATAAAPRLEHTGALVVTALVVILWLLRKKFSKVIKGRFKRGVFTGVMITIGSGLFVVIGDLVVPGVNDIGALLLDSVVNGDLGKLV